MKYLFIALLLLSSNSFAADPWSEGDVYREVAYQVVQAIDWGQTRFIAKNPGEFYEHNPILGEHPSVDQVDKYFVIASLSHIFISHVLPDDWRKGWQYITIGSELNSINGNLMLGIGISF